MVVGLSSPSSGLFLLPMWSVVARALSPPPGGQPLEALLGEPSGSQCVLAVLC